MGRTQKATKNIVTGLVNKAALMLLAFVTKTAFIRLLGAEYTSYLTPIAAKTIANFSSELSPREACFTI